MRTHRQLKGALYERLAGNNWLAHLPYVLLNLHPTPKEDSNLSSAELVYRAPNSSPRAATAQSGAAVVFILSRRPPHPAVDPNEAPFTLLSSDTDP